jgi:polysaccharide deacetylase family protein (PEP-CTERM system associated)
MKPSLGQRQVINVLSVDVEECFHATEVSGSGNGLPDAPSSVEAQTERVLDLFARHRVSATFFMLGLVAEKHPRLVREITKQGHEIGCHSYAHSLVYDLTPHEFRQDTKRAVRCIEDACGLTPLVYRAPSYSITTKSLWALEILAELGFTHDSSIYPIRHDRYGIPGFGRHARRYETSSGGIYEVPIATAQISSNRLVPVGGGGYLRLLPYCYTAAGVRRINESEGQPACVYFHPWELDPEQPRLTSGLVSTIRTYRGLRSMAGKLERLLSDFAFGSLTAVHPVEQPTLSLAR